MFRKRSISLWLVFMITISTFSAIILAADTARGVDPLFSGYSVTPDQPSFDDEINVTATFTLNDETITDVQVQICHDDLCDAPKPMTDTGDGSTFFYVIPSGGFGSSNNRVECYMHFIVTHTGGSFHYPEDWESRELSFNITRQPSMIEMTASPDVTTVFPNQTVTISGKVVNDLGENVTFANVNLTADGGSITNSTTTNGTGHFEISTMFTEDGSYTVNVTVEKDGMNTSQEWDITVNSWPLPEMEIEGELIYNTDDRPVGETGPIFYKGSMISLEYRVFNLGTGTAYNVTAMVAVTGEDTLEVEIGNLTPSTSLRFEDSFDINTTGTGIIDINITIDWDQMAPEELRMEYAPYNISLEIVDIPTWENHTVLVEMFTQTTCIPCVDVEEALERLHEEGDLDFELIMYVYEDQPSKLRGDELGVTSTPDVFIDHQFDRVRGGGNLEDLKEQFRAIILNASARDTPPVDIEFNGSGDDITVSVSLSGIYDDQISGILQVYSIESYSNVRNYQGIPVSNRFHGAVDGMEITDMNPGSVKNLTAPRPGKGFGYVAVLFSPEGNVIQTESFRPEGEKRELYMKEDSELFRIESPEDILINLTLERFQFEEDLFDDIPYTLSAEGLPSNWTLKNGGSTIDSNGTIFEFSHDDAVKVIKDSSRVMFEDLISMGLSIPEGEDGTFSFKIILNSSGYVYTNSVVIVASAGEDPNQDLPPVITDIYLEGAGQKIYFYIEAENVPDGANVKGRVLPCNYGDNAACGIPKEFLLIEQEDGRYRASVTGVDLETFTHLTYNGWIELDGVGLNVTEERKVEISTLIDLQPQNGQEPEDEDGIDPVLIILLIILVIFILAAVVFVLVKKGQNREVEDEAPEEEEDMAGGSAEMDSGSLDSQEEESVGPQKDSGEVSQPPQENDGTQPQPEDTFPAVSPETAPAYPEQQNVDKQEPDVPDEETLKNEEPSSEGEEDKQPEPSLESGIAPP